MNKDVVSVSMDGEPDSNNINYILEMGDQRIKLVDMSEGADYKLWCGKCKRTDCSHADYIDLFDVAIQTFDPHYLDMILWVLECPSLTRKRAIWYYLSTDNGKCSKYIGKSWLFDHPKFMQLKRMEKAFSATWNGKEPMESRGLNWTFSEALSRHPDMKKANSKIEKLRADVQQQTLSTIKAHFDRMDLMAMGLLVFEIGLPSRLDIDHHNFVKAFKTVWEAGNGK